MVANVELNYDFSSQTMDLRDYKFRTINGQPEPHPGQNFPVHDEQNHNPPLHEGR